MVWIALPDGQLELVNRSWSEYTGLGLGEARGAEWQAAVNPDDLPALLERWRSFTWPMITALPTTPPFMLVNRIAPHPAFAKGLFS
jgi:PAS domain-containing protein